MRREADPKLEAASAIESALNMESKKESTQETDS